MAGGDSNFKGNLFLRKCDLKGDFISVNPNFQNLKGSKAGNCDVAVRTTLQLFGDSAGDTRKRVRPNEFLF